MLLGSKSHTAGDVRRWKVNYEQWLENAATIEQMEVESSSDTCTVSDTIEILGPEVVFYLAGGEVGERLMLTLTMTDNLNNVKTDTLAFTVIAP